MFGKYEHLGMFDTPEEAHAAYVEAKRDHVDFLMSDYESNDRVRRAVLNRVGLSTQPSYNLTNIVANSRQYWGLSV
jgi:hypothetical protein